MRSRPSDSSRELHEALRGGPGSDAKFGMAPLFARTHLDKVSPDTRLWREEIFSPLLAVFRVPDFEVTLQLTDRHSCWRRVCHADAEMM